MLANRGSSCGWPVGSGCLAERRRAFSLRRAPRGSFDLVPRLRLHGAGPASTERTTGRRHRPVVLVCPCHGRGAVPSLDSTVNYFRGPPLVPQEVIRSDRSGAGPLTDRQSHRPRTGRVTGAVSAVEGVSRSVTGQGFIPPAGLPVVPTARSPRGSVDRSARGSRRTKVPRDRPGAAASRRRTARSCGRRGVPNG